MLERFTPRAVVSESSDGLRICIPSRRDWASLFLLVWLCFWTVFALQSKHDGSRHFTPGMWLFWGFGEVWAMFALLREMGGQEIITVNPEKLTRRVQIFRLGFTRTYRLSEIKNLRFQPGTGGGRSRLRSRIAFDYGAKTVRFAWDIDGLEASKLLPLIRQRWPVADV
jgi:hypothetical protein